MSTGVIVAIVVVALILVAAIAAAMFRRRGGGSGLRHRFGPEYERALARHDGDTEATEQDLSTRLKQHGDLRHRPLEPQLRERYTAEWARIQQAFVDSPAHAVSDADALIGQLARDRGYPAGDDFDEQTDALSVHRPHSVQTYRDLHASARRARDGGASTEELRSSLAHAKTLFEELTTEAVDSDRGHRGAVGGDGHHAGKHRGGHLRSRAPHRGGA